MKAITTRSAALALLPAALLALGSCAPAIPGERNTTVKTTATSTTVSDTFKATATVTAIDATSRKLKLTLSDGSRTTVKCGPEVRNFSQIQINDRVRIVVTEEITAFLDKGESVGASGAGLVSRARAGAKPGVFMADSVKGTVKIIGIDTTSRNLTFVNSAGKTETFKVGDHIDLGKVKVGDSVTIRHTEAVAVSVEKP